MQNELYNHIFITESFPEYNCNNGYKCKFLFSEQGCRYNHSLNEIQILEKSNLKNIGKLKLTELLKKQINKQNNNNDTLFKPIKFEIIPFNDTVLLPEDCNIIKIKYASSITYNYISDITEIIINNISSILINQINKKKLQIDIDNSIITKYFDDELLNLNDYYLKLKKNLDSILIIVNSNSTSLELLYSFVKNSSENDSIILKKIDEYFIKLYRSLEKWINDIIIKIQLELKIILDKIATIKDKINIML